MLQSILTSKGQTTIPRKIREALSLRPGDQLTYELRGSEFTVRVRPPVSSVAGILKGKVRRRPEAIEKMREVALRAVAGHAARKALESR